jgi:hypothetical protein
MSRPWDTFSSSYRAFLFVCFANWADYTTPVVIPGHCLGFFGHRCAYFGRSLPVFWLRPLTSRVVIVALAGRNR